MLDVAQDTQPVISATFWADALLEKILPQLRACEVPDKIISVLESAAHQSEQWCRKVEEREPNSRFGLRVYRHCFELVEEGLQAAHRLKYTAHDTGLLVLGLFLEDAFGRPAAQLGRESYLAVLPPEEQSQPAWNMITTAHTRHGDLGVYLIESTGILHPLDAEERRILCAIVKGHSQPYEDFQKLTHTDPAHRFCLIGRELDQLALVTRTDLMQPAGALAQFIQWGAERSGLDREAVRQRLASDVALKAAALDLVGKALVGEKAEVSSGAAEIDPVLQAISDWFTKPVSSEPLERFRNWGERKSEMLPELLKEEPSGNRENEVTFSYANYMLSTVAVAIQLSRTVQTLTASELLNGPAIKQRIEYIVQQDPSGHSKSAISCAIERARRGA